MGVRRDLLKDQVMVIQHLDGVESLKDSVSEKGSAQRCLCVGLLSRVVELLDCLAICCPCKPSRTSDLYLLGPSPAAQTNMV